MEKNSQLSSVLYPI